MKRLLAVAALGLTLLVLGATASAQTYTSTSAFTCDAASRYPVEYVSEFTCRGAFFGAAEVYWWDSLPRLYVITPQFAVYNATFQLSGFTVAKDASGNPIVCGGPKQVPCVPPFGTVSYSWTGTDSNGNTHSGTASWEWANFLSCGGRGCQWYQPQLQPGSTITVTQ